MLTNMVDYFQNKWCCNFNIYISHQAQRKWPKIKATLTDNCKLQYDRQKTGNSNTKL